MADVAAQPKPGNSRSSLEVIVDRIWRFFTSVRNAIYEIAFLTLLVLIGTLRGSSVPQSIKDHIPGTGWIVDRWYAWDVFHSVVFAATLALIAIAIVICTLNRAPGIWATIHHPNVRTSFGFLNGTETSATFTRSGDMATFAADSTALLRKRRWRVLTQKVGNDVHIYADKNRWSKLGTFPFHLGLILVLVGGIVASVYGFRDGSLVVPEGDRRSVGHGTGLSVELHRFQSDFSPAGQPINFVSSITVYKDGEPVKSGDLRVNHPMTYENATFYQGGSGSAAKLQIFDANGNIVYDDAIDLGGFTQRGNPDALAGVIRLPNQGIQIIVIAPDSAPMNAPQLDTLHLQSGQLWVQIQPIDRSVNTAPADGIAITQNQPERVGEYTITFEREVRFASLQVGYNPGIPIFIIAVFCLLGGLTITFYLPHRRMRGIISQTADGAALLITPLARRDWSGKRDFLAFVDAARLAWNVTPDVKMPNNGSDFDYVRKPTR